MISRAGRAWRVVVGGGLVAGLLDIAFAWGYWAAKAGAPLSRILQSVAAGLLGKASYGGGAGSAALGIFLQLFIATAMAVTYFLASRRVETLWRRPWLCGAAYGLLLYAIMNFVVVPLSRAGGGGGKKDFLWIGLSVLVHVTLIGIPIALAARRANQLRLQSR